MHNHLREWWDLATVADQEQGREWYRLARAEVRRITGISREQSGGHPNTVAGVVAALSPGTEWSVNLDQAERMCTSDHPSLVEVSTYWAQKQKALRLLGEWMVEPEAIKSVLSGPRFFKTRAFFDCLRSPLSGAVVLDRWMGRVWGFDQWTPRRYESASGEVRELAKQVGLRPYQVQAVVWLCVKRADGSRSLPLPF